MSKKYILIILLLSLAIAIPFLIYKSQGLARTYKKEAERALERTSKIEKNILKESDIKHLPEAVQKYLRYVGVIGKEKVYNFKAITEGQMKMDRDKKEWTDIKIVQYNFFDDELTRLFYMKANMFHIPVYGLHSYTRKEAGMLIKAAGLFTVLDAKGQEMRIGDTTTLLNDMCFYAPAALIDSRIKWETVDLNTVKATFENEGCEISALLYFNEKSELANFVSQDRFFTPLDGSPSRKAQWSTPISNYKEINGLKLPGYGEAVWNFPEGDYCYAKFTNIKKVEYNRKSFE
jgi:hypothetical protein